MYTTSKHLMYVVRDYSFNSTHMHGRLKGGENGQLLPVEIGTKKQKFLENVKSAV